MPNPFEDCRDKALQLPEDLNLYVEIEGFGESRERLDSYDWASNSKGQVVVIAGAAGTGRTSVANYIASLIIGNRNALTTRIKAPRGEHPTRLIHEWLIRFAPTLRREAAAAYRAVEGDLQTLTELEKPSVITSRYQVVLNEVCVNRGQAFDVIVAIIEGIRNEEQVENLLDVFQLDEALPGVQFLIVTTDQEQLADKFTRADGPEPVVLWSLRGAEVETLLHERFGDAPVPFDSESIVQAFDAGRHPMRRVSQLLYSMTEKAGDTVGTPAETLLWYIQSGKELR